MTIRVKIYDPTNHFLDVCPNRIEPKFLEELNAPGSGSFKLHTDDAILARTPGLLNYQNLVYMTDEDSGKTFVWKIEAKKKTVVSSSERSSMIWEVSGRGVMCLLDEGVVLPEYSLRRTSADQRPFSFASKQSQWYVGSEWVVPTFVARSADISYRKGYPKNWPDKNARWMWPGSSPTANQPDGTFGYFRRTFTTTSAKAFQIYMTADDKFDLWVDGEHVLHGSSYKRVFRIVLDLPAGPHVIAVRVQNRYDNSSTRLNMAGLLFSMFNLDVNGNRTSVADRSAASNGWLGRPALTGPPGWDAGDLMLVLLQEAQARHARGPQLITPGWSGTNDSNGVAWNVKYDRTFPIGDDLLSVLTQLTETHVDARMNGLTLEMYNHDLGTDRSVGANTVTLRPARDVDEAAYEGDGSGVKTSLLVRTANGWTSRDADNIGSMGRIEGLLTASNARSDSAGQWLADQAFKTRKNPVFVTTVSVRSVEGLKPWSTFDLGDRVLAPLDDAWTFTSVRVWGISATEDAEGNMLYAAEVAP